MNPSGGGLLAPTLLLGLLLSSSAQARQAQQKGQDAPQGPVVQCPTCNNQGRRDCKNHSKADLALERDGQLCSEIATCKLCGGTTYVDCPICENKAVQEAEADRREKIKAWLEKRREKVDSYLKHPCLHGSGDHVDLVFDLKPMMVGKIKVPTHELMHLYLKRIEEQRAFFLQTVEATEAELSARTEIYMWKDKADQDAAAPKYAGMGSSGSGVKLMGASQVYTMLYSKLTPTDEDLHRHVVHNVTHLFLANLSPAHWIGNMKCGWVDEGLGHYFEFLHSKKCTTYCYEEVGTDGSSFKGGKFRVAVRKMVDSGNHPPFAAVALKNTDQLTGPERALSFSYVDYAITTYGGKKFKEFCRILKAKRPMREAMQEVFGVSPLAFETAWKEYVIKTYPLMEPPG